MIWPVSDCPDPVELIVIPGYHTGSKRGFVTVQTSAYFAWWADLNPATLCVRSPDGNGDADWLELALNATLELAESGDPLGAATGPWTLPDSVPENHVVRGDLAAISWQRSHEAGRCVVTVEFRPDALHYRAAFECARSGSLRTVHLAVGTRVNASSVFDPNPATHGIFHHAPHHLFDHAAKWLTPPPFAYCYRQHDATWSIAAIECSESELGFCRFVAESLPGGGQRFALDYQSEPGFEKNFTSPALAWRFGFADEFAAIRGHAEGMADAGLAIRPERDATAARRVMVCGWHRQVELATLAKHAEPGESQKTALAATGAPRSQHYARQEVYEEHAAAYDAAGIAFDILTIDHGWSVSEGDWTPDPEKWPDLPGFVAAQHARGRRVLLWICVWAHGLPAEECHVIAANGHTRLDPDNPLWQKRVAERLGHLLGQGAGGVGADGLKLDFTGPMNDPSPIRDAPEILHGYRYLHRLYHVISSTARRVRPDCLLDFQCAHPQFARFHDLTRLNDFFLPQRQALRVMETRARIARAAAFDPAIDTDCPAGLEYLRHSARFGNPSLYLTHEQLADPAIVAAIRANAECT